MPKKITPELPDPRWNGLYKTAGVCALFIAALIILQIFVFIKWPPYTDVPRIFMQFFENKLLGLLNLDLLLVIDNLLLIPVFLALYAALKGKYKAAMLLFTAFGLIGLLLYLSSNTCVSMMALSDKYYAATNGGAKAMFLAAGETAYALYNGTAFHISVLAGALSLLAVSIVMLKTKVFGKPTAWFGIIANVLQLCLYTPVAGTFLAIVSVPLFGVWMVMVGIRLLKLSGQ